MHKRVASGESAEGVIMRSVTRLLYLINRLRWRVMQPVTVGVRLILERDGAVLLVGHTYQQHWYLPGGGVEKGETLEEAIKREAAEEIGAKLGCLHLFGIYTNFYERKSDHVIVFSCDDFTLTGQTDHEIQDFDFFSLDELPANLSPGSRRRMQEYMSGGNWPAVTIW